MSIPQLMIQVIMLQMPQETFSFLNVLNVFPGH